VFCVGLDDLVDDSLVEAAFGDEFAAEAVHLLQKNFSGVIDETHTAKIDAELLARRSCQEFTPALFESGDPGSGEATLDT